MAISAPLSSVGAVVVVVPGSWANAGAARTASAPATTAAITTARIRKTLLTPLVTPAG
jgi:hypothetical protein